LMKLTPVNKVDISKKRKERESSRLFFPLKMVKQS
jgi:hypothetical protein